MNIRPYTADDAEGWVRCRALAFLDTAYYDDVHPTKESYDNPSVELVADADEAVVGLLDVEFDSDERTVCQTDGRGGMIWHLAVHPDVRRRGVASALLDEAAAAARSAGISVLEAWTRDDPGTLAWYRATGFEPTDAYLHVYLDRAEAATVCELAVDGLTINSAFAQYVGDEHEAVAGRFDRTHVCHCFVKDLDAAAD